MIRVLGLVGVLFFVFNYGYKVFLIRGDSMNPSMNNLEMVVIDKLSYDMEAPKYGDIIVFYDYVYDEYVIKRVVGLPGDLIEIKDGEIYRNNILYIDEFTYMKVADDNTQPLAVWEGECWVIGDNRDDTWYGIVYKEEIVGKLN